MTAELLQDDPFTLAHNYGDMTLGVAMEPTAEHPRLIPQPKLQRVFVRVVDFAHRQMQDNALTAVERAVEGDSDAQVGAGRSFVPAGLENELPGFVLHLSIGCRLMVAQVDRFRIQQQIVTSLLGPVDDFAGDLASKEIARPVRKAGAPVYFTPKDQLIKAVRNLMQMRGRID
jgi:hypothetical protein